MKTETKSTKTKETHYAKNTDFVDDPDFKQWTAENLPTGKSGFYVTDLDAIIRDRKGNLMILEKKCQNAVCSDNQNITLQIINYLIERGAQACGGRVPVSMNGETKIFPIRFHGAHLLQLSGEKFDGSVLRFDRQLVTTSKLIDILSFKDFNYPNYVKGRVVKMYHNQE